MSNQQRPARATAPVSVPTQTKPAQAPTFAEQNKHLQAAEVLNSTEKQIWYAAQWNETVPQVRLYFQKILCGLDPDMPPPLYREAQAGERVPDLIMEAIMQPQKRRGRDDADKGKGKARADVRVKYEEEEHEQDAMDLDPDEGGGVAAATTTAGVGAVGGDAAAEDEREQRWLDDEWMDERELRRRRKARRSAGRTSSGM